MSRHQLVWVCRLGINSTGCHRISRHHRLMLTSWVDETLVATSVPTENISKSDNYDPADEVEWSYMMLELGYEGELFLLFEEGRGGL